MDTIRAYFSFEQASNVAYVTAGLAGLLLLLVLILVIKNNSYSNSRFKQFKNIDSDSLDSNSGLFYQFYEMAFNYRCKYGSTKYHKNIISGYTFFYDFHNKALVWIDDIFCRSKPYTPSREFILTTICSGQIGHTFCEIAYGGGLAGIDIPSGTPLIAYAKTNAIEIWSPLNERPICSLAKDRVDLQRANKHNEIVSGVLFAEATNSARALQVEIIFPDSKYDKNKQKLLRHDVFGTQHYQHFKEWIRENTQQSKSDQSSSFMKNIDYGIDVDYEIPAPELLDDSSQKLLSIEYKLKILEGRHIDASFRSKLRHSASNITTDFFIVMCSGLGLVTIIENITTGKINYSGDAGWMVLENNRSQIIENVCVQAKRVEKHLSRVLHSNNLEGWPLHSLVVFTANGVELSQIEGKHPLQCDVIKLNHLEQWFSAHKTRNNLHFTKDDYNLFSLLLNNKQGKYRRLNAAHA